MRVLLLAADGEMGGAYGVYAARTCSGADTMKKKGITSLMQYVLEEGR